jgi:hypothetical protein
LAAAVTLSRTDGNVSPAAAQKTISQFQCLLLLQARAKQFSQQM